MEPGSKSRLSHSPSRSPIHAMSQVAKELDKRFFTLAPSVTQISSSRCTERQARPQSSLKHHMPVLWKGSWAAKVTVLLLRCLLRAGKDNFKTQKAMTGIWICSWAAPNATQPQKAGRPWWPAQLWLWVCDSALVNYNMAVRLPGPKSIEFAK